MVRGNDFEVPKEVYDRAKAQYIGKEPQSSYYMTPEDQMEWFSTSIRCGYGLYNCKVREDNGKYICTWWRGDSCD